MAASAAPRVQFAQPASPDIRLGILTRDPTSHLNRELGASIAGRASPAVRLQYVFFSDESKQRGADIVALDRPAWVTAENVCVAKILEWLAHARRTSAATPYVGWLDSDTWLDPQRFAAYFSVVARRAAGSPSWGGLVEHMADYDVTDPLNCPGFVVHRSPEAGASCRPPPPRNSTTSFTFMQGAFTWYSSAAADAVVAHARAHPAMLTVASTPKTREAVAKGMCAMPTDVTLGWLTTAAYAGRELLTVNMAAFIDLYIWPFYGRFRPARAFAVHLGEDNRNGAKLVENRHFAEAATELEPFLPPRFVCTPFRYERDGALEARTARWTECFNNASLGPKLMDNATRQDELWRRVNLRAGTKPVALQEAEINRAAATAEATRQAEARAFLLQLEPSAAAAPAAGAMQPAPL